MKRILCLFIAIAGSLPNGWGQDITGDRNGILKVQGIRLRPVFHIRKTASGYAATMDSPDQNAKDIPVTSAGFENAVLKIASATVGFDYEGTLGADGNIAGTFRQTGQSFPLNLSRRTVEKEKPARPQEPARPYPYYEEEVSFRNGADGVTPAGTLTRPRNDGPFPAAVLISGSGAQNRDEETADHKPFPVIAGFPTRNGMAVLRFDDRGTGASTGNFHTATTYDFSKDAEAGLKYLFQECNTGLPTEYAAIEQTFSPGALDGILKWIKAQGFLKLTQP
jgi:hypothetical protein